MNWTNETTRAWIRRELAIADIAATAAQVDDIAEVLMQGNHHEHAARLVARNGAAILLDLCRDWQTCKVTIAEAHGQAYLMQKPAKADKKRHRRSEARRTVEEALFVFGLIMALAWAASRILEAIAR